MTAAVETCEATFRGLRCTREPGHRNEHRTMHPDEGLLTWLDPAASMAYLARGRADERADLASAVARGDRLLVELAVVVGRAERAEAHLRHLAEKVLPGAWTCTECDPEHDVVAADDVRAVLDAHAADVRGGPGHTHPSGGPPMSTERDTIVEAISDVHSGNVAEARRIADVIVRLKRRWQTQAWDEGADAGYEAGAHGTGEDANPYREARP